MLFLETFEAIHQTCHMTPNNAYRTICIIILLIVSHFRDQLSNIIFFPLVIICAGIYFITLRREYLLLPPSDQEENRLTGIGMSIVGLVTLTLYLFFS